jgi:cysteine-rich repeat protein
MRGNFFRLSSMFVLAGLLGVTPALADSRPIGGKLLKLKTDKGAAKNLFLFKAVKQPDIQAIPDPTVDTTLLLRWQSGAVPGRTDAINLDGNLWKGLGKPAGSAGWKYSDRDATAGGVKVLLIKPGAKGGLLKILAKGAAWSGVPNGALTATNLDLYIGDQQYCATWDGSTGDVKKNDPSGFFLVKDFSAPGTCADAVCGNGRVEGSEECDSGTAASSDGCDQNCLFAPVVPSTFETIQDKIFNPSCTSAGCHGNGFSQGNLGLENGASLGNLVNIASFNPEAVVPLRIDPGVTRGDSYLFRKIAAVTLGGDYANPGGSGMPFGAPVSSDCLDALGDWIEAGAPASGNIASADTLLLGACF